MDTLCASRVGWPVRSNLLLKRGRYWPYTWGVRRVELRGGVLSYQTPPEIHGQMMGLFIMQGSLFQYLSRYTNPNRYCLPIKRNSQALPIENKHAAGREFCFTVVEGEATEIGYAIECPTGHWSFQCTDEMERARWIDLINQTAEIQRRLHDFRLVSTEDFEHAVITGRKSLMVAVRENIRLSQLYKASLDPNV
eukprot:GHVO01010732.1.p1 GENE.GHVO01010732.1~~GHVO01010732.1.p1  ORF type:complete len:194 (-),score=28.46 GHVO01010732.1:314-895(-)